MSSVKDKQIRVGIIGCGSIAAPHVLAIRATQGAQIVGVADSFETYAQAFARRFGIENAYTSAAQLIEQGKPDVVHVLTSPATHCAVALECMERGCHVLVEKPMALNTEEAYRMIEAARPNGVLLSVDHNCRFEPVVRRAAELLASGALGELVTVEADLSFNVNRSPALLQPGAPHAHWAYKLNGGPLQDLAPHPASLILEHLKEVKNVSVLSRNRGVLPKPWPDEIRVLLDGEPAHAEIYISFSLKPDALVLTVRGTEGTVCADTGSMIATVERHSPLPRAAARGLAGFSRGFGNVRGAIGNIFRVATGKFDKTGGIQRVVAGLYDAIQRGVEPPVTMEEGRRVVDLIERIWPQPVHQVETKKPEAVCVGAPDLKNTRQTVLVTGAGGYIGGHLVERLSRDSLSVRALVRPNSPGLGLLKNLDVEIVYGDLSNARSVRDAIEGVETVYHAGSAISGDWETFRQSSVVGTQNVIDAALDAKIKRVVYFSSLAVYRAVGVPSETVINEDWPYATEAEQISAYTRAKIETEKMMLNAYTQAGLPATIVRPGMVMGPRGRVFYPQMGYRLQDKIFIVIGRGDVLLPIVYIDDLIDGLLLCASSDAAIGRAYNFVGDESQTVLSYLHRFSEETKLPSKIIKVPYILANCVHGAYELGAAIGFLEKGVTSRVQLNSKQTSLRYNCERAKTDLGWSSAVSIDEALARTFRWYMQTRR